MYRSRVKSKVEGGGYLDLETLTLFMIKVRENQKIDTLFMIFSSNSSVSFYHQNAWFFNPIYKESSKIFEFWDPVYEWTVEKPYPEEQSIPI